MSRYLTPILCLSAVASILLAVCFGSTEMGASRLSTAIIGQGSAADNLVIWQIRFPRALAAFLVGAALGVSGAALQGLLRNPLAEPGVLGVSATSALFATTALFYGVAGLSSFMLPVAAIIGALLATAIIAFAAIKNSSIVTLILIGVGLSAFAGALMALLLNFAPNPFSLSDLINWSLGSVANRSLSDITLSAPFILLGAAILYFNRRGLSALTLGEDAAQGLGVDLKNLRIMTILGAGLATGGSVALAGAIGFVGIIAPHLIRPMTGHDPARSIVPSGVLAGIILVLADIAIRLLPTQTELKLGVVAALIGAPAFIYIAMKRGRND